MRHENQDSEREQLQQAITHLEAQRDILGDTAVDAALAGLYQKLAALGEPALGSPGVPAPRPARDPALAGERKLVTVMFADISGFTALAETVDPEVIRDLVNSCFDHLVPVVEKYGGTIDKFIGDEIMALFGAPVAHENAPERALRAALDMVRALARFNAERSTDLGVHFGINTGWVIAGGIGTGEQQEYSVMGDTVNVASRLEELSEQKEILVGPDTYRLTASLFAFETLEPIRVRGKAEPVHAYRLLGFKPGPGRARGLDARGIRSPLVGRDAEFARASDCLKRLLDGQGGILSVIGEAGVGKSRLIAEIRAGSSAALAKWLEGRSLSFGQTISYWPFQEILWRASDITEDDSEVEAWHKLEERICALFTEETAEILPYLASLLSLEVKGAYTERVMYLDSEAMGRQVFLASRRFFAQLAMAQPLVLVFEDLHWVDESSAMLLEHLLPLVEQVPILICCISRPLRQTPAARLRQVAIQNFAEHYTEISLSPLTQADSAQLVRNLLEIENLSAHVQDQIMRRAEGNPFFVEEIIRALIDSGAVAHDPVTGRWQATARIETITIPKTIQGVIMARVDRLEEDVKQVLRTAAVIGRSFLYRVLRAVAELDRQLDEQLVELQTIELIWEKQSEPELEYAFKHALVQEATYESILIQKRRGLHAQVGQAIETLFADRLEEFYDLLAYHYARAEVWEKAHRYLLEAGDHAGRLAADVEALTLYQEAMTAYARAFGGQWDPMQRAVLERKIGEALLRRGEHEQAIDHFHQALVCIGRPLPTSRWRVRVALLAEIGRQIGHRLLPGLFLRPPGEEASAVMQEEARVCEALGWIDVFSNLERFLMLAFRGLNTSEREGFPYGIAVASMGLGLIFDFVPVFSLAEGYHRRAVALAEQIQHLRALGLACHGLAFHEYLQGRWPSSLEWDERAADASRRAGDLRGWGVAVSVAAYSHAYRGDFAQALAHGKDLIHFGQGGADPVVLGWGLGRQGYAQSILGQLDDARTALESASELAEEIPDYDTRIRAGCELGRCYLRQGNLEQALIELQETQRISQEHNLRRQDLITPLYNRLTEAFLTAAEWRGALEPGEKDGWLKQARQACQVAAKQGRGFAPGLPEAMRLQGTYEWLKGNSAAARKRWQRSLSLAEEMGQRYDLGLTHLEIGQRLGDRGHLEHAEVLFAEIGAEWDVARTREALGR